jgi:Zn finger protein HypA/HybF involved in hydrogenase expression
MGAAIQGGVLQGDVKDVLLLVLRTGAQAVAVAVARAQAILSRINSGWACTRCSAKEKAPDCSMSWRCPECGTRCPWGVSPD